MIWCFPKFPASFSATNHLVLNAPETALSSSKLYYFLPPCLFCFVFLCPCLWSACKTPIPSSNSSSEISGKSFLNSSHREFIFSAKLLLQLVYTFHYCTYHIDTDISLTLSLSLHWTMSIYMHHVHVFKVCYSTWHTATTQYMLVELNLFACLGWTDK